MNKFGISGDMSEIHVPRTTRPADRLVGHELLAHTSNTYVSETDFQTVAVPPQTVMVFPDSENDFQTIAVQYIFAKMGFR